MNTTSDQQREFAAHTRILEGEVRCTDQGYHIGDVLVIPDDHRNILTDFIGKSVRLSVQAVEPRDYFCVSISTAIGPVHLPIAVLRHHGVLEAAIQMEVESRGIPGPHTTATFPT